jgi:hypothetical protein
MMSGREKRRRALTSRKGETSPLATQSNGMNLMFQEGWPDTAMKVHCIGVHGAGPNQPFKFPITRSWLINHSILEKLKAY